MVSIIKEIEDDEVIDIGGTIYVRVPVGVLKRIGLINTDGSKKTTKIKRAIVDGRHGEFMAIWGKFNNNNSSEQIINSANSAPLSK